MLINLFKVMRFSFSTSFQLNEYILFKHIQKSLMKIFSQQMNIQAISTNK